MTIKRHYIAAIFVPVAAAATIAVTPSPPAEQSCRHLSATSTACATSGNVQITVSPPAQNAPQDSYLGANGHTNADAVHTFGFGGHTSGANAASDLDGKSPQEAHRR
jgi:hypothetical protein